MPPHLREESIMLAKRRGSLRKVARLGAAGALPGHGEPFPHLSRRVEVGGTEEFRRLGQAFNAMNERLGATVRSLSEELAQRRAAEGALRDSQVELQKSNEHLERQVRERTADLAAAKEAAESASRAKDAASRASSSSIFCGRISA